MYTSAPDLTRGPGRAAVPPSGRRPLSSPRPRQVQASAQQLLAYHRQFADLFARREQRQWSLLYLRGQLSDIERKTIEPMVMAMHGVDPAAVRAVQNFLGEGPWDDDAFSSRSPTAWELPTAC